MRVLIADDEAESAALGAGGYVLKPVTETKLSQAIGAAVSGCHPLDPH